MPTEQGYSNQKKLGRAQFKTIQYTGSSQYGAPVAQKTLYDITPIALPVVSVSEITGKTGQVEFWNIEITSHTASVGNVLRMITGTLIGWEYEVIQVIDVNNLYVLPISPTMPIAAETAKIMGWITTRSDSQGSQTVTTGPLQFLLDLVDTTVSEDTATPANTVSLPIKALDSDGLEILGKTTDAAEPDSTQDSSVVASLKGINSWLELIADQTDIAGPLLFADLDFSVTNVDNTAYVELIADIGATESKKVQIFMSSGDPLYLAFGAAASEVDQIIVIPGGNGLIDLSISANTRLSLKAVDAVTVSSGRIIINVLG